MDINQNIGQYINGLNQADNYTEFEVFLRDVNGVWLNTSDIINVNGDVIYTPSDEESLTKLIDLLFMDTGDNRHYYNDYIENFNTFFEYDEYHVVVDRIAEELIPTFKEKFLFFFPINNWDVTKITDMNKLFYDKQFDEDISNWNVSNVTNMRGMFANSSFNQPLDNWNVSNVTNMSGMFQRAVNFNQPLGSWNVSNVTDMSFMFSYAKKFNQDISRWERKYDNNKTGSTLGNVTDMYEMFVNANEFDQDLHTWNVQKVTNFWFTFAYTKMSNKNIKNIIDFWVPQMNIDCNNNNNFNYYTFSGIENVEENDINTNISNIAKNVKRGDNNVMPATVLDLPIPEDIARCIIGYTNTTNEVEKKVLEFHKLKLERKELEKIEQERIEQEKIQKQKRRESTHPMTLREKRKKPPDNDVNPSRKKQGIYESQDTSKLPSHLIGGTRYKRKTIKPKRRTRKHKKIKHKKIKHKKTKHKRTKRQFKKTKKYKK